jgi:hypothetical protein
MIQASALLFPFSEHKSAVDSAKQERREVVSFPPVMTLCEVTSPDSLPSGKTVCNRPIGLSGTQKTKTLSSHKLKE